MVLVTTAINSTIEIDDDILLLGEWCNGEDLSERHHKLVKGSLNYHWKDRDKFYKDHKTIIALYNKLLPQYSDSLNLLHNVSYSLSFWAIIIGPWLLFFISNLFDRWSSITQAKEEGGFDYVALSVPRESEMIATNMKDYYEISGQDIWNNYIFSKIVKNYTSLKFKEFPLINEITKVNRLSLKHRIKNFLPKLFDKLSFFSLSNKIIFVDSYMPINFQWTLEKLLGQKPSFFHFYNESNKGYKHLERSNLTIKYKPQNDIETFIISMAPLQIPQSYIEKFDSLLMKAKSKNLPQSPKVIFTSNAHFFNDQFKFWSAIHKEKGAKLILAQHGGGIGSMQVLLTEYLEKSIADKYITWGWSDKKFSNTVQLPALKLLNSKKYLPKKGLLHVMDDNSRYARGVSSTPISSLHIDYLEDQYHFSNLINHQLIRDYVVRKYPNNYNWEYKEKWNQNVKFDSNKFFLKSIYEHKLIVISSNSTTFLQVLASNIPTVVYLTSKYNELRDTSKNDFESLKKVGILFDSGELAANHINSKWSDISGWWQSQELQSVRIEFCKKYARTSNDSLLKWKSFFEEINIG